MDKRSLTLDSSAGRWLLSSGFSSGLGAEATVETLPALSQDVLFGGGRGHVVGEGQQRPHGGGGEMGETHMWGSGEGQGTLCSFPSTQLPRSPFPSALAAVLPAPTQFGCKLLSLHSGQGGLRLSQGHYCC